MSALNFDFLEPRELLDWPEGDNSSDTVFGSTHFNLTTLLDWNYTYYSNDTISNGSKCWLTFEPHIPVGLFNNGSFLNATRCFLPVDPIGLRGKTGSGMAAAFTFSLVLILTVLAKHGKQYLRAEKRFYPIGRRWQWYWGSFVCGTAVISLFLNIEVDRYHVQQIGIVVTSFFFYLMCMGSLALTWEAVRHWGSWLERQYVDPNPFIVSQDDRRSKIEFWLPLWAYFWIWMNFFMIIPRNWNFASQQRSPEQSARVAIPTATGIRFKIGAFCLFIVWLTICFSMWHSIKHYKPRNRGIFNRGMGLIKAVPLRFVLLIPLCLSVVGYQALISFEWKYSVVKADGPVAIIYGWGYGAQLLMLWVQCAYGFASPNEDKELLRQRAARGELVDDDLGLVRKPAWWRRVKGEHIKGSFRDQLLKSVREVGGGRATGRREEGDQERHMRENMHADALEDDGIELGQVPRRPGQSNPREDRAGVRGLRRQGSERSVFTNGATPDSVSNDRALSMAAQLLFPDGEEVSRRDREAEQERIRRLQFISSDDLSGNTPPAYADAPGRSRPTNSARSGSHSTTNSISSPPQQVRSMLDL